MNSERREKYLCVRLRWSVGGGYEAGEIWSASEHLKEIMGKGERGN